MTKKYLALDVGEVRIGVATATDDVKIAVARDFIPAQNAAEKIKKILDDEQIDTLVVGFPRNQSGEATAQTAFVKKFVKSLGEVRARIAYQDESLTSVKAENILKLRKQPYEKGEIDSLAASLILQDYLEEN